MGHVDNRQAGSVKKLIYKRRLPSQQSFNVILIDSSASTLQHQRLQETLGAVKGILLDCYQKRHRIAVIQFGNQRIETLFAPARATSNIAPILQRVRAGGGTPLKQGILQALELFDVQSRKFPGEQQHLYLLTDGRSRDSLHDIRPKVPITLIDTEAGAVRLQRCAQLASQLSATYITLDQLKHWS